MFSGISNFFTGKNTPVDPLQPLKVNREKKVVDVENIALKWLEDATYKITNGKLETPVDGAIITTIFDKTEKRNIRTYVVLDPNLKNDNVEPLLTHAGRKGLTSTFEGTEFAAYEYFLARLAIYFEKDAPQIADIFKEAEHVGNLKDSYILKNAASEMVKRLKASDTALDKSMLQEATIWKQV